MFKRKEKKTGIETPEFRKPTPPPPPPTSGSNAVKQNPPRCFCRNVIGDKAHYDQLAKLYDDLIKMDGAKVYFSVKSGITAIVTTQEWTDYFMGRSNIIPNIKENN